MFGESSAIYPHAVIHICSCQQCCVEISFSTKLSEFEPAPGRKASFFPRQGTWIFERFLRHATYEFSAMRVEKKKRERTLHIRLFAGSILPSCNIVAMRLVHAVWIAMNDRFGEGKWPVMASYDNIYTRRVIEPALSSSVRFRKNAAETSRFSPFLPISK